MSKLYFTVIFAAFWVSTNAQHVLTLQPGSSDGKDAEVFNLQPNATLNGENLRGNAWTFNGSPGVERGLIEFDLSTIHKGSIIDSAFLSLYFPLAPTSETHSGNNESYLKRIISYWGENEVNWYNQPGITDLHRVELPRSTADYQDYTNIDVTDLLQDMVNDPGNSFGFMVSLQEETFYRRMSFASSDESVTSNHPKLIVHYREPSCTTLFLQPGSEEGKDAEIYSLQPTLNLNNNTLRANAWTFGGDLGIERSFIEFDLSAIPSDATINAAYLTLFSPHSAFPEFHSGNNSAWLERVTSAWNETSVNWNNQPSATSNNQVSLATSNLEYQDYRNIDVTLLVRDMMEDPDNSFGFRISLKTEDIYRRLGFVSSDYEDEAKHPRLEICYSSSVAVEPVINSKLDVDIFPNPWSDVVHIKPASPDAIHQLEVTDVLGHIVFKKKIEGEDVIHMSEFSANIYFFRLTDLSTGNTAVTKMIRQ